MREIERMLSGRLYYASDSNLRDAYIRAKRLVHMFNQCAYSNKNKAALILKDLLGSSGTNIQIEPPFRCDYGSNITVGDNFYANYDCVILDVCEVKIGSNVMFGPRVCLFTAAHPIDVEVRNSGLEYGRPISVGDNVWIGGCVTVNPGIKIGNDVVIGSGSVVTKSIPDGVVAAGNPCKVLRKIDEHDRLFWQSLQYERMQ